MKRPLFLLTNDDGIDSPGLHAAARAMRRLGDVIVAAPSHQQSAAGRCFRGHPEAIFMALPLMIDGQHVPAFHLDASPACVVHHALHVLCADRLPDMVVSGINYGENVGTSISASGTLGAAMEAASVGIPAVAVSLQTPPDHFHCHGDRDWSASEYFLGLIAEKQLRHKLPMDVDLLKIDVPAEASLETPWQLTRVARQSYVKKALPQAHPQLRLGEGRIIIDVDFDALLPGTDVHALVVDKQVAVTPISLDPTSRAHWGDLLNLLTGD